MKFVKQVQHQGDTQFFLIDGIPASAKKVEKQFIAASEQSGSFHALFGEYDMYEHEEGFIIDVKKESILNHSLKEHLQKVTLEEVKILPKKDHRHSTVTPGIYFVGVQQRFDPLSGMKEKVRD